MRLLCFLSTYAPVLLSRCPPVSPRGQVIINYSLCVPRVVQLGSSLLLIVAHACVILVVFLVKVHLLRNQVCISQIVS